MRTFSGPNWPFGTDQDQALNSGPLWIRCKVHIHLHCDNDIFDLTFLFVFRLASRQKAALHVRCPGKNPNLPIPRIFLMLSLQLTCVTWNRRSLVETSSHADASKSTQSGGRVLHIHVDRGNRFFKLFPNFSNHFPLAHWSNWF